MIRNDLQTADVEAVSERERRQLVERVLASKALSRSGRQSELFRFVCDLTLAGRAAEINEQHVGETVFGRPNGYDSSIDGIVRTQASRLRQRLSLYFENEGRNEPLIVTIPRGSYIPVFEQRQRPAAAVPEEPAGEPELADPVHTALPTAPARTPRSTLLPWILTAVLACACAVLALRYAHLAGQSATKPDDPFWNFLFAAGQSTLLVPGDSSLVNYQGLAHHNVGLAEYVSGEYRAVRPQEPNSMQNLAARLATPRYTSIVDLEIAQALALIAKQQHSNLELRYPREARPNDFKQGNLILVGSPEATPWVALFEPNMNFVFDYQRLSDQVIISVLNRRPRVGEPAQWTSDRTNPQHRVYAVVAYLPNLTGTGNVLILEGITMAGTECAWDFVSDQGKFNSFLGTMRLPNGRIPHFEVVLGTSNISGSAGDTSILATRVHNP